LFPGEKFTKAQTKTLSAMVANGVSCPCRPLKIALHKDNFAKGSISELSGYGFTPFNAMRLKCEQAGYIRVKAERSFNTDKHPISTIESTQLLIQAMSFGAVVIYKPDFFYLLKGYHDGSDRRHYLPVPNPNHAKLRQIRAIMIRYYALLETHNLSCDVPHLVVYRAQAKHTKDRKKGNLPEPPDTRFKYPVITFTDNINVGGRMYGGFWIGCKREFRKYTRINGEQCVEIDFSAMHPQLLYQREGYPPQDNIYLYPKIEQPITGDINRRNIAKLLMLSMINIEPAPSLPATRRNVINAVRDTLNNSIEYAVIEKILCNLETKHYAISKYFYSGAWRFCMTQESNIIRAIIKTAISHKILILPVHDAVICKAENQAEIESIITAKTPLKFEVKKYV